MYTSNCLPILWHWVKDKGEEASVWDAWLLLLLLHLARHGPPATRLLLCIPAPLAKGTKGGHLIHALPITVPFTGTGVRDREKGELELEPRQLVLKSDCPGEPSSTDRHSWFPRGGGFTNMQMEEQSKGACSGSPRCPGPTFPEAWLHWQFRCHDTLQPWNRLSVELELDGGGCCNCKRNTE